MAREMRRYPVAVLLVVLAVAGSAAAQSSKTVKIAVLTDAMVPWHSTTEGFRDGLKAFGYVEGKNVAFEARATRGDRARVAGLAAELVQQNPDLILCVSDACGSDTGSIPVLFVQVSDPVRRGLVKTVARPGSNVTGIANLRAELTAKRLEFFKELVPPLRRVLVTYDPREKEERDAVSVAKTAASRLRLELIERPISAPLDIEAGLGSLAEGGRDGILIVQSGTNLNIAGRSLEVATSERIPTMYPASFWSNVGALASYGPDQYAQGRQAARLAHKILTGTPPREIPVELPDRIELIVNLKTAARLGLNVPQSIVLRADRVIE
jgi:putative tryptophan/tyrosine transport system substrate-binding protein